MIRTSKVGYCEGIDVTVKSCALEWRGLAPTWDMVMEFKRLRLSKEEYTRQNLAILESPEGQAAVQHLVEYARQHDPVVLLCYCRMNAFCHRVLLARHLEQFGLEYGGEITIGDFPFDDPPSAD